MPSEADRAVNENPAALRREVLEHLGDHDRRMSRLGVDG